MQTIICAFTLAKMPYDTEICRNSPKILFTDKAVDQTAILKLVSLIFGKIGECLSQKIFHLTLETFTNFAT